MAQEAAKEARWTSRGAKNVKHSSKMSFLKNFQEILEKPTGRKCETFIENRLQQQGARFCRVIVLPQEYCSFDVNSARSVELSSKMEVGPDQGAQQ